jgi:hypothetical protein
MLAFHPSIVAYSCYPVGRKIEEQLWEEPQGIEVGIDSETSCAVSKYFLNP